jgi:SPP1 family predicted phage head-tail adaptor
MGRIQLIPRVKIGELRDHVTIQGMTSIADPYGEPVETWAEVATVPAEVIAVSGREAVIAQQTRAVTSWRVRMRYRGDVTPAHRFLFGGRILAITWGGDPDGNGRELVFYCSESIALAEAES